MVENFDLSITHRPLIALALDKVLYMVLQFLFKQNKIKRNSILHFSSQKIRRSDLFFGPILMLYYWFYVIGVSKHRMSLIYCYNMKSNIEQ